MKMVEIYTKSFCPYCNRAKELLRIKGVTFVEYDITANPNKEREMHDRAQRDTVPEIFVGGELLGDCNDLFELDERNALDPILELNPGQSG